MKIVLKSFAVQCNECSFKQYKFNYCLRFWSSYSKKFLKYIYMKLTKQSVNMAYKSLEVLYRKTVLNLTNTCVPQTLNLFSCSTRSYIFLRFSKWKPSFQARSIAQNPNIAPPKHLEQCHQCDLRPLFNQYDCLSFCASTFSSSPPFCPVEKSVEWARGPWMMSPARELRLWCGSQLDAVSSGALLEKHFLAVSGCVVLVSFCRCPCPALLSCRLFRRTPARRPFPTLRSQSTLTRAFNAFLCHFCTALHSNVISFVRLKHRKPQPTHRRTLTNL